MAEDPQDRNGSRSVASRLRDALLRRQSLNRLNIVELMCIFYPVALSLTLGLVVYKIGKGEYLKTCTGWTALTIGSLTFGILVLYSLLDWDDAYYAADLDRDKTTCDRLMWLAAVFIITLSTVCVIEGRFADALLVWTGYVFVSVLLRDRVISEGSSRASKKAGGPSSFTANCYSQADINEKVYWWLRLLLAIVSAAFFAAALAAELYGDKVATRLSLKVTPWWAETLWSVALLVAVVFAYCVKHYRKHGLLRPLWKAWKEQQEQSTAQGKSQVDNQGAIAR